MVGRLKFGCLQIVFSLFWTVSAFFSFSHPRFNLVARAPRQETAKSPPFPAFWRLDTRASKAQLAKIRTRCLFGWFGVSLDECKTLGNHPTLNPPNAFKQTPLLEYTQCTPPVEQSSLLWLIQWARGNCALKRSVAARPCCPPVWRATRGGAKRLGCSAL